MACFGIILSIIPLSLALLFKDRFKGFLTISAGLIGFHLILAVASQALGVFTYNLLISTHSIVVLVSLIILFLKRHRTDKPKLAINYFIIFTVFIITFQLWSVHYSYTGLITTSNGYQTVENSSSDYPYFSDEWIGISLINYSIENKSLPLVNPLWQNGRFNNPTFPFFSTISEFFLITELNPLTTYPALAILSGLLICFLAYLISRRLGAGLPASLLVALSIPYIVNGANLPGIWNFLPLTAGLILFLFALLSVASEKRTLVAIFSILSIIFYPPIIAFSLPLIIAVGLKNRSQKEIWLTLGSLAIIFLVALAFIFGNSNLISLKDSILSLIFRTNLQNGIPKFNIFTIIPIWVILLALPGFWQEFKNKNWPIIGLTLIGLVFWTVYSGTQKVFIIEYQRVIVITSILLTILSGLGAADIFAWLQKKYRRLSDFNLTILILIIFTLASPFYTRYTDWQKLVMQIRVGESLAKIAPASPANIYLTPADLELFKNIKNQRFIAPPWKGLVIGVATQNFPLDSKPSTLTNKILTYNTFLSANCAEKTALAQKFQIAYAYSAPFTCPNFTKLGESDKNLVLYKFQAR